MPRKTVIFEPGDADRRERRRLRKSARAAERAPATESSSRRDRRLPDAAVPGPFGPGLLEGGYWNLAVSEPAIGDERVDAGDVLRRRLVRWDR